MWTMSEREGLYRDGLRIRALASASFLVLFGVWGVAGRSTQIEGYSAVVITLTALLVINPLLWRMGVVRGFPLQDFYFHWLIDIIAVSVIVRSLGMFDIPLVSVAYMIMIVSSAAFVTMTAAMVLALASSLAWATLWLASLMGILEHRHVQFGVHWSAEGEAFLSIASTIFFFLFAYVSGSIAEKLRRKTLELIENQAQLLQAVELERASRSRVELLSAIVQHDIYGPLAVIEAASSEVRRSLEVGEIEEAKRFLRMIDQRLPGISSAVESLGLFRSKDVDGLENSVAVKPLVEQLLEDLRADIEERRVDTGIRGGNLYVAVDRQRLYHVLRNLISNAVKCVPSDGTGAVSVELARSDDQRALIAVSDNGPGLSDALINSLTGNEPLREGNRGGDGSGLGVGLSLAQSLARAWGGKIEYAQVDAGGARVSVVAPLVRDMPV